MCVCVCVSGAVWCLRGGLWRIPDGAFQICFPSHHLLAHLPSQYPGCHWDHRYLCVFSGRSRVHEGEPLHDHHCEQHTQSNVDEPVSGANTFKVTKCGTSFIKTRFSKTMRASCNHLKSNIFNITCRYLTFSPIKQTNKFYSTQDIT